MTRKIFRLQSLVVWFIAAVLLWLALRGVDWGGVRTVLATLTLVEIGVLVLVNAGIVVLLGARWWLLLHSLGHPLSLLAAAAYRLAGFSLSYFTPGPHFGGEPLQIYLAVRRGGVPAPAATASVVLDKVFEWCANFAFLAFGIGVLLTGGLLTGPTAAAGLAISSLLILLPLVYLLLVARGIAPLTTLAGRFQVPAMSFRGRLLRLAAESEEELRRFVAAHRLTFLSAVLLSGVIWVALVLEFALAARFLGLALDFRQLVSVITAVRLAMLLPMPGALGTMEAALILVTQALTGAASAGASLALLIRARDMGFALLGLWAARRLSLSPSAHHNARPEHSLEQVSNVESQS